MNTILASADAVAADAVSARLIGLNPDDIEYLTLAHRLGVGVADMDYIDVRGDELERISRRFERMGAIEDRYGQTPKIWTFHGPHEADDPNEHFLDPRDLKVVPGQNGWSELHYFRTDNINIKKALGRARGVSVYAYTEFYTPRTENAHLWVGSGEGLTIWIDGVEVYRFRGRRRHKVPTDVHPIRLGAGHHQLLVQVHQTSGSFDFSLNICEAMEDDRYIGNRVHGLKFTPPGDGIPPVPRTDMGTHQTPFEFGEWLTPKTFDAEILDVIDQQDGLRVERINAVAVDNLGRLWVGGNDGVRCRTSNTTWTHYGEKDGIKQEWTLDLIANPNDGSVWANLRGKLYRFDGEQWEIQFADDQHNELLIDNQGRFCATVWMIGGRRPGHRTP